MSRWSIIPSRLPVINLCRSARLCMAESLRELPFACVRAAIYVQYFSSGEGGVHQEQNCIHDFFDFTHPADRVQPFEKLMGLGFMHRSIDGSQRNGVYTNAFLGILNCECARHRIQSALRHNLNSRPDTCDRLTDESS